MATFVSFTTDAFIKTMVAAYIKENDQSLMPAWWDTIITSSRRDAYNEIVGTLIGAGYSIDIINAWDRAAEFEEAIALFWALTKSGVAQSLEPKLLAKLDRRAELEEVDIAILGVLQYPSAGKILIGSGNTNPAHINNRQHFDGLGYGTGLGDGGGGWFGGGNW